MRCIRTGPSPYPSASRASRSRPPRAAICRAAPRRWASTASRAAQPTRRSRPKRCVRTRVNARSSTSVHHRFSARQSSPGPGSARSAGAASAGRAATYAGHDRALTARRPAGSRPDGRPPRTARADRGSGCAPARWRRPPPPMSVRAARWPRPVRPSRAAGRWPADRARPCPGPARRTGRALGAARQRTGCLRSAATRWPASRGGTRAPVPGRPTRGRAPRWWRSRTRPPTRAAPARPTAAAILRAPAGATARSRRGRARRPPGPAQGGAPVRTGWRGGGRRRRTASQTRRSHVRRGTSG